MKIKKAITIKKIKDSLNIKRHSLDIVIVVISLVKKLSIAKPRENIRVWEGNNTQTRQMIED